MDNKVLRPLTLFLCFFLIPAAYADVTMVMLVQLNQGENRVYIKDDHLRFVMKNPQGDEKVSIYSSAENKMIMLDSTSKQYMVLDQQKIAGQKEQMKKQMLQMISVLKQRMAQLPEDRKVQAKLMIEQLEQRANPELPKVTLKALDKKATVGRFVCDKVQVLVDGLLNRELCLADAKALSMSKEDYATLKAFFDFMRANGPQNASSWLPELEGVPIATRDYIGQNNSGLRSLSFDSLNTSLFEIPSGYQAISLDESGIKNN